MPTELGEHFMRAREEANLPPTPKDHLPLLAISGATPLKVASRVAGLVLMTFGGTASMIEPPVYYSHPEAVRALTRPERRSDGTWPDLFI